MAVGFAESSSIWPFLLDAKADLQVHLEMAHLAVDDVAASFHHLEPFKMAQRGRGLRDGAADGVFDAVARTADDLDYFVRMCAHEDSPTDKEMTDSPGPVMAETICLSALSAAGSVQGRV